ncbi:pyrroline-5-carboxylate reductase [Clostridium acidisoli DSM 12555]|uniref:Pyrroline-5-carboxylate reductase n=1 Tax=Clostridium acidisoli DSM 12555 TaxID=1121291 RepID=A0A1W1Y0J1_9CLOT|nr:pyrroline-5-carboxylate reductase [Clostridium acidisoli]SMC29268.1 pyrroline-5-carboxylate reductase [Clostridium acidisoli DSM 12555]
MSKNIGFIGCGNMAKAMIGGIVTSKLYSKENVIVSNPSNPSLEYIKDKFGIITTNDNLKVAKFSDILILSIKPNKYKTVINTIKDLIKENTIIISIAAGISIKTIEEYFDKEVKIIRTMPNTPAMVGEGMSSLCSNKNVNEDEVTLVEDIFRAFGQVEVVDESLMDVVTGVSGSSPAFVYMFIEALADGAVLEGLPRDKAYKMAAQAVLGSAKMVLETGKHPGQLKDEVCSPAGTTIESVYSLEKNDFRGSIIEAVKVCVEKAKAMGNK